MPRFALVSFYEGRKHDGTLIQLYTAEALDAALNEAAGSALDSSREPALLVDLDAATSRTVSCLVTAQLGDATEPLAV